MSKQTSRTLRDSALNVVDAWKGVGKWVYLVAKSVAKWLWGIFVLWYDTLKVWDKYIWKEIKKNNPWKFLWFLSDKMLRTLWALGIAWWLFIWWQKIDFNNIFSDEKWPVTEFFENDPKVFGVDVSRYNEEWAVDVFNNWSDSRDKSDNPDVRRPKFVYILWRKEKGKDEKALRHYENVKSHKENLWDSKWLAVGSYAYFDKSQNGITDDWIEKQVDEFISVWETINQEWDWLIDLTPMLDFEYSSNETVQRADSELGKKHKAGVLKWLKLFEKKTWVTPGIYTNASTYRDFFYEDPAFSRYSAWIASYNPDEVDQDRWIVTYRGKQMEAEIIQFSDKIKNSGFWTKTWNIDWNTSTQWQFWKLIQDNNDAPRDK